jgi:hypothetical protein
MVHVEHADFLMFGGSSDPCAMIQIESIGGDASTLMGPLTEVRAEKEHNIALLIFCEGVNISCGDFASQSVSEFPKCCG